MLRASRFLFFFFQAEDGIRDYKVTGVQTCALPISPPTRQGGAPGPRRGRAPNGDLPPRPWRRAPRDRKSVVLGKSVDLGGRRIIKKKKGKRGDSATKETGSWSD